MTDYEIDVSDIEPEYKHTIARQAGREVDDGFELHLSKIVVTLSLTHRSSGGRECEYFSVTYKADHEAGRLYQRSVGNAHSECKQFGVEKLMTALEYAHRAMIAYVGDVGPDYLVESPNDVIGAVCDDASGDDVQIHSALEVDE